MTTRSCEPVQDLFPGFIFLEPEGVHVRDDGFFIEVVADQVGHVAVHQLVIRDAVAHGVGDRDAAGAGGVDQSGAAEHGVGAELQRVQEFVVDPLVDHVHALLAGGGAHVHPVAAADQVAALDQFHAHQAGQQRVLEVGAVEHARGQDHHGGIVHAGRCRFAQRGQQSAGVLLHRADQLLAEGLRQALGHRAAVLQDVAHAGGHAYVVLQDTERSGRVADDVDAGDVDPHAARRFKAVDLAVEMRARGDELPRDDAVRDDGHLAVDVIEEGFEGPHSLGHTAFQDRPLVGRDDPGHDVQRERPLLSRVIEGDTTVQEGPGHRVGAGRDVGQREFLERPGDLPVGAPGLLARGEHFVIGTAAPGGR